MAYRMLGSAMEAEDIVQEAYLRYRTTPPESIRTLKSFLTTIVHHLCIDHLKSAQAQRENYVGPYRWVRNPIYISALLVVLGEAWLFLSLPLLLYSAAMVIFFHLFVIGYEEPTLRRSFGETYVEYVRTVPRWIPCPPRA